eukprot:TRINITY_DN2868_c1_g2_i2.p2 TRINITY_DN2868_c1_g2~~TRINITY_DN2868_c1_g2_i2.p2  ORF type:complete len:222 (-),score=33.46 TRINITY_DN2868_c1_g2_i2:117-782(-)
MKENSKESSDDLKAIDQEEKVNLTTDEHDDTIDQEEEKIEKFKEYEINEFDSEQEMLKKIMIKNLFILFLMIIVVIFKTICLKFYFTQLNDRIYNHKKQKTGWNAIKIHNPIFVLDSVLNFAIIYLFGRILQMFYVHLPKFFTTVARSFLWVYLIHPFIFQIVDLYINNTSYYFLNILIVFLISFFLVYVIQKIGDHIVIFGLLFHSNPPSYYYNLEKKKT